MMRLTILYFVMSGFTFLHAQEKNPSNRHFWHSVETTAPPEAVWSVWTEVSNWKAWDTGLKDAEMEANFNLGAKGIIVSLEDRKSTFKVVAYAEGQSYTYKTKLPLGSLYVKRYLETNNGVTVFTHEVWFKGMTSGVFAKSFGNKFRKMLPGVLQNIKNLVEGDDIH